MGIYFYLRNADTAINIFTPVKVDEASEEAGLDESLHGERAYEDAAGERISGGKFGTRRSQNPYVRPLMMGEKKWQPRARLFFHKSIRVAIVAIDAVFFLELLDVTADRAACAGWPRHRRMARRCAAKFLRGNCSGSCVCIRRDRIAMQRGAFRGARERQRARFRAAAHPC